MSPKVAYGSREGLRYTKCYARLQGEIKALRRIYAFLIPYINVLASHINSKWHFDTFSH